MLTRERIRALIEQHELSRVADEIMDDTKPCMRLKLNYALDEVIPIGGSKMGGSPDVPEGFEWPLWNDVPLMFIAQIRVSDAKPFDEENLLPERGLLYFFFDQEAFGNLSYQETLEANGTYQVFYLNDEHTPLVRMSHPLVDKNSAYEIHEYQSALVRFEADLSLRFESNLFNPETFQLGIATLTPEEKEHYFDCTSASAQENPQPTHQMLGHENDIQFGYQSAKHAQAAWQIGQPEDWILLLQVDTDDAVRDQKHPGFLWGDVGLIYYWMNKNDLKSGRTDRVWLDLICT
jgi:uncharacterized protein YwqG